MHRQQLLTLLEQHRGVDQAEESARLCTLEFVKKHANCFDRGLSVGHVTGSGWIVNQPGDHVLLTFHRKLSRWLQLGGHADGHSDVLQVALREAREESGLTGIEPVMPSIFDVDIHLIPAHASGAAHYHFDIRFALRATNVDDLLRISDESIDLRWISVSEVDHLTREESILRMARKWKEQHCGLRAHVRAR